MAKKPKSKKTTRTKSPGEDPPTHIPGRGGPKDNMSPPGEDPNPNSAGEDVSGDRAKGKSKENEAPNLEEQSVAAEEVDKSGERPSSPGQGLGESPSTPTSKSDQSGQELGESPSKSSPADRKERSGISRPQREGAEKCTATSKSTGKRCSKYPLKGQTVCQYHGGANRVSKAAGARRENKRKAMIQASRLVQLDGVDMDPIDHLLDSLYRASQLVNVYAIMCAEIDSGADEQLSDEQTRGELGYEIVEEMKGDGHVIERFIVRSREKLMALNKHSEAQLHPFLVAYTEALRDRARFAKMAIDAGIAKMQTELVERQVEMAQEALEAAIAEMKLDKSARQRFVASYARNLREIGSRGSTVSAGQLGTGT